MNENLRVALDWLEAISSRDRARLITLSDADIAIQGPRSTTHGIDVLERWFDTTHLRVTPREAYLEGDKVMVVHDMEWLDAEGNVSGTLRNASLFTIQDGMVSHYLRDDEPEALPRHGFGGALPNPVNED